MANEGYRPGDHWMIDARTGFKIRRSEAREEYTGAIVHKDEYESRHPQEFVRGKRDRQAVATPRPEQIDKFNGPLITHVTEAAEAGSRTIVVLNTARFIAGDRISVYLDNAEEFVVIIQAVSSSTALLLLSALPWSVAVNARVLNNTAVARDYGWDR
jgi:hypothetical protein